MQLVIVPFRLKDGVTESTMLSRSDDFDRAFVQRQPGILDRKVVKDQSGGYADVILLKDDDAITQVMAAESNSPEFAALGETSNAGEPQIYTVVSSAE